jgi:hypothetical protein
MIEGICFFGKLARELRAPSTANYSLQWVNKLYSNIDMGTTQNIIPVANGRQLFGDSCIQNPKLDSAKEA